MPLGAWLIALVTPMVGRVLLALGFQVVTITGVTLAVTQLKSLVLTHLGGLPADMLQLMLLAGVGQGLGMVFGAITFRIAYWQIANSVRILGVAK